MIQEQWKIPNWLQSSIHCNLAMFQLTWETHGEQAFKNMEAYREFAQSWIDCGITHYKTTKEMKRSLCVGAVSLIIPNFCNYHWKNLAGALVILYETLWQQPGQRSKIPMQPTFNETENYKLQFNNEFRQDNVVGTKSNFRYYPLLKAHDVISILQRSKTMPALLSVSSQ